MTETRDNAGVIAPPPLLALAAVVLGLALDWLMPAFVLTVLLTWPERIAMAVVLFAGRRWAGISGAARLPRGRHPCRAVEAGERAGDRRHLRLAAQSDVCRPDAVSGGDVAGARLRLDAGDDDRFRARHPLRRGQARGALSRGEIRRGLPAIQGARAALRHSKFVQLKYPSLSGNRPFARAAPCFYRTEIRPPETTACARKSASSERDPPA